MKRLFHSINTKYLAVCAAVAAFVLTVPGVAMATESEAAKGVGEAATKVNTEGEAIVIKVLTAVVGLIVFFIIVPKAIKFIRRLV